MKLTKILLVGLFSCTFLLSSCDFDFFNKKEEESNVVETQKLEGNSYTINSVDEYDTLEESEKAYVDPLIGTQIKFLAESKFEWRIQYENPMMEVIAYGTYTQNGTEGSFTQTGAIQNGEDHTMPEDLRETFGLTIKRDALTISITTNLYTFHFQASLDK